MKALSVLLLMIGSKFVSNPATIDYEPAPPPPAAREAISHDMLEAMVKRSPIESADWSASAKQPRSIEQVAPPAPPEPPPSPVVPRRPLETVWTDGYYYPARALLLREEGVAHMILGVDETGRVTNCTIESSSGSSALDHEACTMVRRSRFIPGQNAAGNPSGGVYRTSMSFSVPDQAVFSQLLGWAWPESASNRRTGDNYRVRISIRVEADGLISRCSLVEGSSIPEIDQATCNELLSMGSAQPGRDAMSAPIMREFEQSIFWR